MITRRSRPDGLGPALAGADADAVFESQNEDFPIADSARVAGARRVYTFVAVTGFPVRRVNSAPRRFAISAGSPSRQRNVAPRIVVTCG